MNKQLAIDIGQIAALSILYLSVYQHTLIKLVGDWATDDNYSHGFLIPFISGYMMWQKWDKLSVYAARPNLLGLLVIATGMGLHIVGNIGAELFVMRVSMIVTLLGLSLYLLGKAITKEILLPIAYLIFMVPLPSIIWNQIAFPLQLFAAAITEQAVDLIGIPIFREGNTLHLPTTTLEVVDACSGLRSLVSLLALSAAFAYFVDLSKASKWALFFSAVPIAIGVNVLRLMVTAMMAHWVSPDTAHGFLHDASGLLMFILAFCLLLLLYVSLSKLEKRMNADVA
jgi:exosortase